MVKKTAKEKLDSIGFVFGFKESKQVENENGVSLIVSTKTGTSEKYPTKYSNKKDFWVEEIKDGDVSELFIDTKILKECFLMRLNEEKEDEGSFNQENYMKEQYLFTFPLTLDDYVVLNTLFLNRLDTGIMQKWESEEVHNKFIEDILSENFNNKELLKNKTAKVLFDEFLEVKEFLYEQSIKNFMSEEDFQNKPEEIAELKNEFTIFKSKKKI